MYRIKHKIYICTNLRQLYEILKDCQNNISASFCFLFTKITSCLLFLHAILKFESYFLLFKRARCFLPSFFSVFVTVHFNEETLWEKGRPDVFFSAESVCRVFNFFSSKNFGTPVVPQSHPQRRF